jgi:cytochrome oxidase Cu insertion factor (SCO1/SenC/PrrC family)
MTRPARQHTTRPGQRLLFGLAGGLLLAAALAGCSGGSKPGAPSADVGQELDVVLPHTVSASTLLSTSTGITSLKTLQGKVVVVSDMMTLCQETCPLDTADVVAAARAAERAGLGSKIEFLSVTIDPSRDTTTQLAAYRKQFSPAPADWLTVTGTSQTLAQLWKRLGVYIEKVPDTPPAPRNWLTGVPLTYDLTHSDEVFFFDTAGHERFILDGAPHLAAGQSIPPALKTFLDADGRRNLTSPDPDSWTYPQELRVLSWLVGRHIPAS